MAARADIVAAILADVDSVAALPGSAYSGRRDRVDAGSLPSAYVYGTTETAAPVTVGRNARTIAWSLNVQVDVYAAASAAAEIEPTLDTLTTAIIAAVAADTTLGGSASAVTITARDFEYSDSTQAATGAASLTFVAEYEAAE